MQHLDEIEENSRCLYEEALEALVAEKYASAVALSIFSFEEAGKYAIIKRELSKPDAKKKKVHRHEVKHEEIGELFWNWSIYSVLNSTFEDFKGFATKIPDANPDTIKFIEELTGGNAVDFLRFNMFSNADEMRDYIRGHFPHPELPDVVEDGRLGHIEKIRSSSTIYVDLNDDRSGIKSTPKALGEEAAEEWFKIAWFGQEYIALAKKIWNGN